MLSPLTSKEVKHQGHTVGQPRAQSQPKSDNTQLHAVLAQIVIKPPSSQKEDVLISVMDNYLRVSKRGC